MVIDELNNPIIKEKGAIHPCHIPVKNPAGLSGELLPPPGKHELNKNVIANRLKKKMYLRCICFEFGYSKGSEKFV